MADWDADSPQLRKNLESVIRAVRDAARERVAPSLALARDWHETIMQGLDVPSPDLVGRFRGEPGLEHHNVRVGPYLGIPAAEVASELSAFEGKLKNALATLDRLIPQDRQLTADDIAAIIDVCAFAHAEWVRIHPFGNGNGRTARIWANFIAMRYGLPPFIRLRPRPDQPYGQAGAAAMQGDWQPTARIFRQMYYRSVVLR